MKLSLMTTEEIYAIKPDEFGWRTLPTGNEVALGHGVTLGYGVKLGDRVKLGDWVTLGHGVTLGNRVKLGNWVKLGDWGKLGDWVTLGDGVKLGDGVEYPMTPLQIQCHPYIVYPYDLDRIGVGCIVKLIANWAGIPSELAEHPECLPWDNYIRAIARVREWIVAQRPATEERGDSTACAQMRHP